MPIKNPDGQPCYYSKTVEANVWYFIPFDAQGKVIRDGVPWNHPDTAGRVWFAGDPLKSHAFRKWRKEKEEMFGGKAQQYCGYMKDMKRVALFNEAAERAFVAASASASAGSVSGAEGSPLPTEEGAASQGTPQPEQPAQPAPPRPDPLAEEEEDGEEPIGMLVNDPTPGSSDYVEPGGAEGRGLKRTWEEADISLISELMQVEDFADLDELLSRDEVAARLIWDGDYGHAEPLLRERLEAKRKTLGDEDPDTVCGFLKLGTLLRTKGDYCGAEPLYRKAMETCRRILDEKHPVTLASIHSLGSLLQDMGDLDRAEKLLGEALEGRREKLGDKHPSTLSSISNLGLLLQDMRDLDRAEKLLGEALEGRREKLGDKHPSTLTSISNLGLLLEDMGDLAGAGELYSRARPLLPFLPLGSSCLSAQSSVPALQRDGNECIALTDRPETGVVLVIRPRLRPRLRETGQGAGPAI